MKLLKQYHYETLMIIGVLVFIGMKIIDLSLPFAWDEMGVYIPGAFQMVDTGKIGLLPSSLIPLYSRGHPLLFTFANALVFKIFGESVLTGHIFSLFISVLTLVVFFLFARKEFTPQIAFFSMILLSAQPIFFSLSTVVLPEMMLTLFTIISIWCIVRERWILYAFAGSLAMMIKESAIVIPMLAMIVLLVQSIREHDLFSLKRIRLFLLGMIPIFIFGLFILIQKIQNGWFLFPLHVGYLHFDLKSTIPIGKRILNEMFFDQGRWLVGISFLAGIVLCFLKKPLNLVINRKIILIFVLLGLFIFLFADINYYLTRYILYFIPFIILVGVYTIVIVSEKILPRSGIIRLILIVLFTGYGVFLGHNNMFRFPYSSDMSYKYTITVVKDAIAWTEQQPWKNDTIEVNFPIYQAIRDKRNGYLSGDPIPNSANFEKRTHYGLLFYLWEAKNIPNWKNYNYHILRTWSEFFANVALVEYEHDSTDRWNDQEKSKAGMGNQNLK